MKRTKWVSILIVSIMLLGALAACGPKATPTPVPTKAPAAPAPTKAPAAPTKAPAAPTKAPAPTKVKLPDLGGRVIRIGSDTTYPPFEYVDQNKNIIGYDVDMINALAKLLNFKPKIIPTGWDGIFAALQAGQFDMVVSGVTITPERAKSMDFSIPYMHYGQVVLVRADETKIKSKDDLKGHIVGVQTGTTNDETATKIVGDKNVRRYDTFDLAVVALVNKDVDAVIIDKPAAEGFIAVYKGKLKIAGEPFTSEDLGLVFQKGSKLVAPFNAGLEVLKKNGTLDKIYAKWFKVNPKELPKQLEEKPAAAAPKDETIIIGTTDKVTDLDPANSYDFHTWEIHHNTMDTLLHYTPGTTNLVPGIAESMPEISADGKVYTFKIRKGLKFPDGTPVDAKAVKWSIDRVIRLKGQPNWLVTSFVDHVEAVDEYTVKFYLKEPVNYFPLLVATAPYSPLSPKCYDADKIDSDSTCGGYGPYKIVKWERDQEMDLEANPDYQGDFAPKVKHIIVKYFSDPTTMRLALENGEIDVAAKKLNPSDYEDLAKNPKLQVVKGPGSLIRYICFNVKTKPFDNVKVREAIAAAVDRDAVAGKAFMGTHQPLYSMVPMGMWSHIDAFKDKYGTRNLDMAKKLLKEAGFSTSNPLKMDLWWTPTHYGPTESDVASVVKDALEETGMIKVSLQSAEWATYTKYMTAGSMPVFLLGWYPDYLDPDDYTAPFAETNASKDMGIFYSNPKMDALLKKGRASKELRSDSRKAVYEDIQKLWADEVPTLPLTQGQLTVVAKKNIKGIVLDPNMLFHYFLLDK